MPLTDAGGRPVAAPSTAETPEVARVLVVCTANITRSPYAAALLEAEARRRLGARAPVWVGSAGVHAVGGSAASSAMAELARERGLDLARHRSRPLSRADVEDADLVVVMTEAHRDEIARLAPAARERTFTLPELARLLDHVELPDETDPAARVREVARRAHRARPYAGGGAQPEDVADPIGGPAAGYVEAAEVIGAHVERVADALFGPAPR